MSCTCLLKKFCQCTAPKRRLVPVPEPTPKPTPAPTPEPPEEKPLLSSPKSRKRPGPFERARDPEKFVKQPNKALKEAALSMPAPYGRNKDGTPSAKKGRKPAVEIKVAPPAPPDNTPAPEPGPDAEPWEHRRTPDGKVWGKTGPKPIPWMEREREPIKTDFTPKLNRHGAKDFEGQKPSIDVTKPWHERIGTQEPPDPREILAAQIIQAGADVEALEAFKKKLRADYARSSFAEFFRQAWDVVEPNTALVWNWHLSLMCGIVQAVFTDWLRTKKDPNYLNTIRNLVFGVPPGSSKSRALSVAFPAWAWLHSPGMRFICLSVNEDATMRDAAASRDLIQSKWYADSFQPKWGVRSDQDAKSDYGLTSGGGRISKPSKSEIVGLRGDCVVGDTLVATELGDIPIRELHEMYERPLVWTVNETTRKLELKPIVTTRALPSREVIEIRTNGTVLRCTPDHLVWTDDGYMPAEELGEFGEATLHILERGRQITNIIHGEVGVEDVYDIQVENNHNFFANGIRVHNCLLIDDPNNPKKAENKNERDEINNLWSTNQYNRVNDMMRSLRIGVQQRTHAMDWTGNVVERQGIWTPDNRDGWLVVALPAEYESHRKFVMPEPLVKILREIGLPECDLVTEDPRTVENESIDPRRMPRAMLEGERNRWKGSGNYAAQMQQAPALAAGNKVDRGWWAWCRLAGGVRDDIDDEDTRRPRPDYCNPQDKQPAEVIHAKHHSPGNWDFDWITISVDPAAKKTTKGSNWGILVIAGKGGKRYVLDDATRRGSVMEICAVLVALVKKWKPDTILIESKAAGPSVMETLLEAMSRGDVPMVTIEETDPGSEDKEMRLEAAIPYIANGMVHLRDGATWLEEFVAEISIFPNGQHDDRVDALSQCLNFKRVDEDCWAPL